MNPGRPPGTGKEMKRRKKTFIKPALKNGQSYQVPGNYQVLKIQAETVKIGSDIKAQEKKILSGISEEITDPQSVLEINRLRLHISILKSDCGKLRNELLIIANEKGKNSKEITELKNLLHKTATQLQAAHKKINKIKAKCDFASSIEKENVALKLVIEDQNLQLEMQKFQFYQENLIWKEKEIELNNTIELYLKHDSEVKPLDVESPNAEPTELNPNLGVTSIFNPNLNVENQPDILFANSSSACSVRRLSPAEFMADEIKLRNSPLFDLRHSKHARSMSDKSDATEKDWPILHFPNFPKNPAMVSKSNGDHLMLKPDFHEMHVTNVTDQLSKTEIGSAPP